MISLLFVWLVLATIMEYLIIVAPLDIRVGWKLAIYYVLLAPHLLLMRIRERLGITGWFESLSKWFKAN